MRRIAAVLAVLLPVAAAGLAAQAAPRSLAVELTLGGGYFQPTGTHGLVTAADPVLLTRRAAWLGSGHLSLFPAGGLLGLDLSGGFTPERILQQNTSYKVSRHTDLTYGAAQVMVGRSPQKPGISYMVGGGFAVLYRKNGVLDPTASTTNVGPAASVMVRVPVDQRFALRFDGQDVFYSADYGFGKKTHGDLLLTGGVSITW
jgi:hypothetical protein